MGMSDCDWCAWLWLSIGFFGSVFSWHILPFVYDAGARMCHDGSDGSPVAVQRSSNRTGRRHHGGASGHANAPYGSTAAETGQSFTLTATFDITKRS